MALEPQTLEMEKRNRLLKTAIAILNWNGKKLLEEFLPSVVKHSTQADIYLIDNASTDDSLHFVENNFPQVKLIKNSTNLGYAGGYNLGVKKILEQSDYDFFCFLNSDVEVTENWLNPIENLFKNDKEIAVVQPKVLDYKNRGHFEYAGAAGGFIDNFGYPFCRGRVFWTLEKDEGQYDDNIQTFWASGACLFIRKEDFLEVNGFDEKFFAHMEEIDLCWRLNNLGKKVFYCGQSTIFHLGGGTLKTNSPKKTYLNFRNNLGMLAKNLPASLSFPIIFTRLCLDGITGIVFFFYEGFSHCWAIVRSHFGFYRRLPHYLSNRNISKKNYFHKKFVPFQYFILKRKYYSDLK